jgi:hypothetical protein
MRREATSADRREESGPRSWCCVCALLVDEPGCLEMQEYEVSAS